ncbi:unnamed protein product [Absidia cylindrospora]
MLSDSQKIGAALTALGVFFMFLGVISFLMEAYWPLEISCLLPVSLSQSVSNGPLVFSVKKVKFVVPYVFWWAFPWYFADGLLLACLLNYSEL